MRFVGYSIQSKGYRLFDDKTSKVVICRYVIFNEADFGRSKDAQNDSIEVKLKSDEVHMPEKHEYPERRRTVPVRYGIDEYADTAEVLDGSQITEPSSLNEALTSDCHRVESSS